MCGILGVLSPTNEQFNRKSFKKVADKLFELSARRGGESAGLTMLQNGQIQLFKQPKSVFELKKNKTYLEMFRSYRNGGRFVLGHARLVTNGDLNTNANNQPINKEGIIAVHNGIIVNVDKLWQENKNLKRQYEVDTEVLVALVRKYLKDGKTIPEAITKMYGDIDGAASIGLMFEDLGVNVLATNTGSLYYAISKKKDILIFASEYDILFSLLQKVNLKKYFTISKIKQLLPNSFLIISQNKLKIEKFNISDKHPKKIKINPADYSFKDLSLYPAKPPLVKSSPIGKHLIQEFEARSQKIKELKRCTKCILPETIPYISFDDMGVCNYCRSYQKVQVHGRPELEKYLNKYRKNNGKSDVLMTFSGGRDSSYGLHYLKREMGMNPVAFSYDWGMITDLGRRNQSRMTAKLGVEHILISADIQRKRENIRKNVVAWLKKPDLGTVPLFMAGDKQFFYYANKLGRQMGIDLIVLCLNPLEKTNFKFGFCGVAPDENVTYRLDWLNKIKLAGYYSKEYLTNPSYINTSLMDTFFAYFAYYLIPHDYLSLFDYIKWDEKKITKVLFDQYDWEAATDTKSTWRIGDGTAPFYNYIYYIMAGFTENDTFRSNQIREGALKREEALKLVEIENQPRYDSMQWYADTIGFDLEWALKIIHQAPRLY